MSDDLEIVKRLKLEGKLVPFVGAGLSTRLGLPSWSKLISIIAEQMGYDPDVFRLSGCYRQLAEYFVVTKGSIGPLRSEMDKQFNPTNGAIAESRAHNALVEMRLPIIYTTNYDTIIERAFLLKGVPCSTIANIDDISTARPGETHIVKFHGSFSDDASLVLTESSYFDRLSFESAMDIKLRADTLGKSLLFIGYSLSDLNMRYLLYKLHNLKHRGKHELTRVPSAFLTTFGADEIQKSLLAQWDVSVIELEPINKDRSIDEFLESLV